MAIYMLENPQEKGIKLKTLLSLCTEKMLAHNTKGLKDYLNEAKDHKVVVERTDENGSTILTMPYPAPLLEKIANGKLNV